MPSVDSATQQPWDPAEMPLMLRELRSDTIPLALPGLVLAGILLTLNEGHFRSSPPVTLPGLVLLVWPLVVMALRRVSYPAAVWGLVLGGLLADALVVRWTGVTVALSLLALPVGCAALFAGMRCGLLSAAAVTLALAFLPPAALPAEPDLRFTAALGVWGTVGLIWLTSRPLESTMEWSWINYRRSILLLERARDYQEQLAQTAADLADANLQLTRLNRLAQGMRQAAEEARRAKEQFVANVSHELRTPLNMIIGFSEMILQAPETYASNLPRALLADLSVILRNSQHLAGLIDDVLDLSQIDSGQVALSKEWVNLREVVQAAVEAVKPLFVSRGLAVEEDVPADLYLYCDRLRIREVVLNLLSNAGRFTEQGGARVCARREGREAIISVADTGPGIATEDLGRLFRPFQQLDGSLRRRHGGSGLGLAISKSFVELHGGTMWVESKVGVGTTFYFRLPADEPAPAPVGSDVSRWFNPEWHYEERTRGSLAPAPVVRPRIVVLERGGPLQRLLARYMDGVELVTAGSLQEAAADLAQTPAQALLVNDRAAGQALADLSAPGVLPYGTPAIVCSLPGVAEAASALGVRDYLVKPIAREELLATLERHGLAGKALLIVDDEPEARRLFWRMLASAGAGYRVLTAKDGVEAMAILRESRPDGVLLDLVMPNMDGFQFLAAKNRDPDLHDIPVLAISARDPAGDLIASNTLSVTRGGGLSLRQVLACVEGLIGILGTAGQAGNRAPKAAPSG